MSSDDFTCEFNNEIKKYSIICAVVSILLLIIILIPLSFIYVGPHQWALLKNGFTNTVYLNRVLENGRNYALPHYTIITFPRNYQTINLTHASVSDNEGKEFFINIIVYYRLAKSSVVEIYQRFGLKIKTQIYSIVESTIKNTAPLFTTQDYFTQRYNITNVFYEKIKEALSDVYIDLEPNKLFMELITLEATTQKRQLDIVVQTQKNEAELYNQQVGIIKTETERMVKEIESNITVILRNANATVQQYIETAKADANKITGSAEAVGIRLLADYIGIKTADLLSKFIRFISILNNSSLKILDINQSGVQLVI